MTLSTQEPPLRKPETGPLSLQGDEVNHSKIGHIPALDGLRGIAILIVLLSHFIPRGENTRHGIGRLLARASTQGWIGVDLFFVLSGFLITGILLRSKSSERYFLNFYSRRALRIFPLYYFVLTIAAICLIVIPGLPESKTLLARWPSYWFYMTNFAVARHGGWQYLSGRWIDMTDLWSLAVEEHFYLVWPMVVWLLPERLLIRACITLMILAPIFRGMTLITDPLGISHYTLTYCRMDALAMGALLAVLVRSKPPAELIRKFGWIGLICTMIYGAYVFQIIQDHAAAMKPFRIISNTCVGFMFTSLLCLTLTGRGTAWLMAWRPLRFFGVYSYGLYIYHGVLLQSALDEIFPPRYLTLGTGRAWVGVVPHYILCIGACCLVAYASYHLLEKRFLKLKRFF